MAQAKTDAVAVWGKLLKLTTKTAAGQGNYRPADESKQGGLYLPIPEMEQYHAPGLVQVSVFLPTEVELETYFDAMKAKLMAGSNGGSGRA